MAIKFDVPSGKSLVHGAEQKVDICADTEAEILALPAYGEVVTDVDGVEVKPAKLSTARTVGYGAIYELSPSGVWTKM